MTETPRNPPLHLFEAFGIEMEYMIVARENLRVAPVADRLLADVEVVGASVHTAGPVTWCNELVRHVIELKCTAPAPVLEDLPEKFQANIADITGRLAAMDCTLLGTGAHPFMDPFSETVLWIEENAEIYEAYNRVFDCRGHGWSNLQSTHINLPFSGDDEFGRLHAAIRMVLPLIPALAASTPLLDGAPQPWLDTRLDTYRRNQARIPSITGLVIPEAVFSRQEYEDRILNTMYRDISPYDPNGILQEEWLNSRGAIARFDRDAIEIRVIDVQEAPYADLAVCALIISAVRAMVEEHWCSYVRQRRWSEGRLEPILVETMRSGGEAVLNDREFLGCWGLSREPVRAMDVWKRAAESLLPEGNPWTAHLELIFRQGCLARRILTCLGRDFSDSRILSTYRRLSGCIQEGRGFETAGDCHQL